MTATLLASWALTALAVPLLAATLIDFERWHHPGSARAGWLDRLHGGLLRGLFRRPALLILPGALLLGIGWFSYSHVQTGFMPDLDEGGFVLDYLTAPGTSLTESEREMGEIEAILRADPAVADYSLRVGAGFGGDLHEANSGDFVIRLRPLRQRDGINLVMNRISDAITAHVPGVQIDPHELMGDEIGDLTGVPQPIEIKLAAADPAQLDPAAARVADAIGTIPGVNSVDDVSFLPAMQSTSPSIRPAPPPWG